MSICLTDESLSFQKMPKGCPVHFLDFGLLTNLIAPLVQQKRRHLREQRKEFLINKTLNVNLKQCFNELYRLGRISGLRLRSYHINNKKNMMKLVDTNEIPLIYLEEAYQKQLDGPPTFVVDDWIKCDNHYGVVTHVYGKSKIRINLVKKYVNEDQSTPMFHKWLRDYHNLVQVKLCSVWECQKIGHDTHEWKHLRAKLIQDYNDNLSRRKELWKKMEPKLIYHSVMDNPLRSKDIFRCYKRTWLQMKVNVLDKSMWENLKPRKNDNPSHLHSLWWYAYTGNTIGANLEHLRNTVLDLGILD